MSSFTPLPGAAFAVAVGAFALMPPPRYAARSCPCRRAVGLPRPARGPAALRHPRAGDPRRPRQGEWSDELPPPDVAAGALGDAVAQALRDGLEEVAAGDVARALEERIALNPGAAEREADGTWT